MKRSARSKSSELVVFLGPSLDLPTARKVARATFRPPARQGDIWRALRSAPRAILLIDGVFEAQPSVWHSELLEALQAGVQVFGASSMGALRAVELERYGMKGVGQIFRRFRSGEWVDDADVALLHASEEHGYRALTVPLVNVRHVAELARKGGVLGSREAQSLVRVAEATFYQDRRWAQLERDAVESWAPAARGRWAAFVQKGLPDLKREDALEALRTAAASCATPPRSAPSTAPVQVPSSLIRRRRLVAAPEVATRIETLRASADAEPLAREALERWCLATLGRAWGLSVSGEEREAQRRAWHQRRARGEQGGKDASQLREVLEEAALAEKVLALAARLFPDAMSLDEALAAQALFESVPRS